MKNRLLLTAFLFVSVCHGQNVKFKPKLISFRNERLAIGIGLEVSPFNAFAKFTGAPGNATVKFGEPFDSTKLPHSNYTLDLDLYSPNSVLGLWSSISLSNDNFYIKGTRNDYDAFQVESVEIPLYLKLRTGRRNGSAHAWFAAGASYNFVIDCTRRYYLSQSGSGYYSSTEDKTKQQLKNHLSLGAMIAYEVVNYDKSAHNAASDNNVGKYRLLLFTRLNYHFQNSIDRTYNQFLRGNLQSAIGAYDNFDLKYWDISIGLKIFYKFPKKLPQ